MAADSDIFNYGKLGLGFWTKLSGNLDISCVFLMVNVPKHTIHRGNYRVILHLLFSSVSRPDARDV